MTEAKERFRDDTRDAILKCARWLEENAESLVGEFTNDELGCESWSLSFSFDSDRYPCIVVDTDCKMVGVIDGTYSS